MPLQHAATHCNTLQHPATHCNRPDDTIVTTRSCHVNSSRSYAAALCARLRMCSLFCDFTWCSSVLRVWHDAFTCVTWLIHLCDMTHSYMLRDSHKCVLSSATLLDNPASSRVTGRIPVCGMMHSCWTWLIHMLACWPWLIHVCDMTHTCVWHDSYMCVTWLIHVCPHLRDLRAWLIHVCDMTHSYVWHDSFICVTWRIHMCDKTHVRLRAWLIHVCDMTHVTQNSFICVAWLIHMCDMTHSCVTWLIHMCDLTHSYGRQDSRETVWKEPYMSEKSHTSCGKNPIFSKNRLISYKKSPTSCQKNRAYCTRWRRCIRSLIFIGHFP